MLTVKDREGDSTAKWLRRLWEEGEIADDDTVWFRDVYFYGVGEPEGEDTEGLENAGTVEEWLS